MKKKTILSIVALLIVVLAIFGITKFVGAEGKGEGETVVVTHDSGETTVNKNSKRIVVFDFGILDSLDKLNVQGIVGVVQNGLPEHLSKFAGEEYSSVGSLKEPNMEKIFELNPDLIIIGGRQAEDIDSFKEIAPTVNLAVDGQDYMNSFKTVVTDLGKLFDKEDEAQTWLDNYYAEAKKIGDEIKKAKGDESYVVALASSGQFMIFSEGGMGTILKDDMGLKQPANMPEQDSITLPTVSIEGLSEIDADNIIVIGMASDKQDLAKNSVFNEIRAVKDGNYVFLDASPFFSQAYNPMGRKLLLDEVKNALM